MRPMPVSAWIRAEYCAGMVTVTLTDYRHTAQLSQELRRLGVPAAVFYIPQGQFCYEGSAREVPDPPKKPDTTPDVVATYCLAPIW